MKNYKFLRRRIPLPFGHWKKLFDQNFGTSSSFSSWMMMQPGKHSCYLNYFICKEVTFCSTSGVNWISSILTKIGFTLFMGVQRNVILDFFDKHQIFLFPGDIIFHHIIMQKKPFYQNQRWSKFVSEQYKSGKKNTILKWERKKNIIN